MKRLHLLCCALAVLLSSCGNFFDSLDESEVPDYTRNWLREQHGETLTFRSSRSGQVRTLTVTRSEGVNKGHMPRTNQAYSHEYVKLRFRDGPDSLLNIQLDAAANQITVLSPNRYSGAIHTHKSDGRTAFYSGTFLDIVAQDTTLGGRPYRYLGRIAAPPVAHPTDTVTAVYFSRYEGLVGFTTRRGGLWTRQ
jgi:hypothetical protein